MLQNPVPVKYHALYLHDLHLFLLYYPFHRTALILVTLMVYIFLQLTENKDVGC